MQDIGQDFRYGLRALVRNPGFTATALLSLALGIGANSAVFSLVHTVFLRPLPVEEPERLVSIYGTDADRGAGTPAYLPVSYPNYLDLREQSQTFSDIAAFTWIDLSLAGGGEPERLKGQIVSGNYFGVFGAKPVLGRTFLPEEDRVPGGHPVVVLSHALWQRRFGSDPGVLERTILLNNQPFRIVGVASPGFRGPDTLHSYDLWVPLMMYQQVFPEPELVPDRKWRLFNLIGRLRPQVDLERVRAEVEGIAVSLRRAYPDANEDRGLRILPLSVANIDPNLRDLYLRSTGLLMTIVAFVLFIACFDLANLLLVRGGARRQEIAIRFALGARRGQLVRQLFTESVLLSLLGGVLGLLMGVLSARVLWQLRPPQIAANALQPGIDPSVLGFTLLVSLLASVAFGVVPALESSRAGWASILRRESGRSRRHVRLRETLVALQIALSLMALIGAGLFLRSLRNAERTDPGIDSKGLLLASFDLGALGYDAERGRQLAASILQRIEALPGVRSAEMAEVGLLRRPVFLRSVVVEGGVATEPILIPTNAVGPRYFETLGIPILRGRSVRSSDRRQSPSVAVINQVMAQRLWPGEDPIGKRFSFAYEDKVLEVVGIAANVKYASLGEEPQPYFYVPLEQRFSPALTLHLRLGEGGLPLVLLRREIQQVDPNLPLSDVEMFSQTLNRSLWAPRMAATLLSAFALLGLGLAMVGIYGTTAYTVRLRWHEIGVRMALGADRRQVLAMVLGRGMAIVSAGLLLGVGLALILARTVSNLLHGIGAGDSATFLGASALLAAAALLANLLPAWRATSVEPVSALRAE